MNRKQFILALAFVALFSFLGGIVGGAISGGGIIMAAKEIIADSTLNNPKKINFLEAKHLDVESIFAKSIVTNSVRLENDKGKIICRLFANLAGDPAFAMYSNEKPYSDLGQMSDAFRIVIKNSEPLMVFTDKDLDERIIIGIKELEPFMNFNYRDKLRLRLGTNKIVGKSTGHLKKMKGSICTYDNKGYVTSQIP